MPLMDTIENILREYSEALYKIIDSEDVVAIFDTDLNYMAANNAACELLQKKKYELEGKNILELFPSLTASKSHRQMLHALSGEVVIDVITEGTFTREGAKYISSYYPLKKKEIVYAILAITKKLYFPNV